MTVRLCEFESHLGHFSLKNGWLHFVTDHFYFATMLKHLGGRTESHKIP